VLEVLDRLAETPRQATRARRWMRETDSRSESVGETRARLLLLDLGHHVRSQVGISDDTGVVGARVDLLVGDRVVVEFDGLLKYEGAQGRAALAAEKRREDWLRTLGYEVVRLTWADLARPHRVEALVRSALERIAAREPRPTAS
jgi:very-short-patch-repair endonuclease